MSLNPGAPFPATGHVPQDPEWDQCHCRPAIVLAALACLSVAVPLVEAGRAPGVDTNRSVTYFERFYGGELATVSIVGDGDTDLDIFVYDAQGRLVAQGVGPTDIESVSWFVPGNQIQTYRIVVRNLGGVWNRYTMRTN
jgi:hypothetical protein